MKNDRLEFGSFYKSGFHHITSDEVLFAGSSPFDRVLFIDRFFREKRTMKSGFSLHEKKHWGMLKVLQRRWVHPERSAKRRQVAMEDVTWQNNPPNPLGCNQTGGSFFFAFSSSSSCASCSSASSPPPFWNIFGWREASPKRHSQRLGRGVVPKSEAKCLPERRRIKGE